VAEETVMVAVYSPKVNQMHYTQIGTHTHALYDSVANRGGTLENERCVEVIKMMHVRSTETFRRPRH
jgi:hypothetical protein